MTDFKHILARLNENLSILREREAKYGGSAPLDLLNQIDDHQQAITLTGQAITGELTEAEWREATRPLLLALQDGQVVNIEIDTGGGSYVEGTVTTGGDFVGRDQIRPTATGSNIAQAMHGGTATVNVSTIHQAPDEPPFWRRLSRANMILAIILGFIATTAAVLAVPQLNAWVFPAPIPIPTATITPTPFPSPTPLAFAPTTDDESLIVIATFDRAEGVVDTRPQREIRDAIRAQAADLGFLKLRAEVEKTVLDVDDRQAAEALGHQYQASMVIWGDVSGARVTVNFLNLRQPELPGSQIAIKETERVQLKSPDAFASFIVEDLTGQMTFLSLFALGQSYHINTDYDQALPVMEQAVASLPADLQSNELAPEFEKGISQAYMILAWLYQTTQSDSQQAVKYYTQALIFDPESVLAYNNRGNAYLELGERSNAMADFNRAIAVNPDQAWVYYNRGNAHSENGSLTEAIADYTTAIKLDPDYATAYFNRGNAYRDKGQLELAVDDFSQVIRLNPAFLHEAYFNRGYVYYQQRNLEKAVADFERTVDVDPNYYKGWNDFCWTAGLLGRTAEALAACDRAVTLEPDDGAIHDSRGLALALSGKYAEARKEFEFYVKWATAGNHSSKQEINQRKEWIKALEEGRNPFTEEVLQALR